MLENNPEKQTCKPITAPNSARLYIYKTSPKILIRTHILFSVFRVNAGGAILCQFGALIYITFTLTTQRMEMNISHAVFGSVQAQVLPL